MPAKRAKDAQPKAPSPTHKTSIEQENLHDSDAVEAISDAPYITSDILRRAKTDFGNLTPGNILALQRTIGNQAVTHLVTKYHTQHPGSSTTASNSIVSRKSNNSDSSTSKKKSPSLPPNKANHPLTGTSIIQREPIKKDETSWYDPQINGGVELELLADTKTKLKFRVKNTNLIFSYSFELKQYYNSEGMWSDPEELTASLNTNSEAKQEMTDANNQNTPVVSVLVNEIKKAPRSELAQEIFDEFGYVLKIGEEETIFSKKNRNITQFILRLAKKHGVKVIDIINQSIEETKEAIQKGALLSVTQGRCQAIATHWVETRLSGNQKAWEGAASWASQQQHFMVIQNSQAKIMDKHEQELSEKRQEIEKRQQARDLHTRKGMTLVGSLIDSTSKMLSRNIVLDEDLQKILQEEIAASNDKRIKSLIPSAAKINRLPASKPGISIGELLSEIKGPGYFYITLSNGSTKHGMACQINLEGVMQFIDPNGAVWEGTPDKVAAMVQTYWEQLGLTSWYKTSGIWSVWELWSKDALIIF